VKHHHNPAPFANTGEERATRQGFALSNFGKFHLMKLAGNQVLHDYPGERYQTRYEADKKAKPKS
jgi:hypothetical protein